MDESYMETCLKAAFSKPRSGTVRVSIMNRESAWKMLDKPLRAVLVVAAQEQEPPAAEDDDDASPRKPVMQRPRSRMRRAGRNAGPPHMSWLHSAKEIVDDAPLSTAYQLAVLLIHKQMDADNWDEAWNARETLLRESCMADGVHPVWHLVGEKTPLLGQFLAFPKAKVKATKKKSSMGTDFFWIDPRDRTQLATVLKLASAGVDDPDIKVALQKATNQLNAGRTVRVDSSLQDLSDSLAFITRLLDLNRGVASSDATTKACTKADASLSEALDRFEVLQKGDVSGWSDLLSDTKEDALSVASRTLAWQHAPAEAEACTSTQLEDGLGLLIESNIHEGRDRLTWWRLKALLREKKPDQAMEVLDGLSLDANSDVSELLPLIISMGDERANAWLSNFMDDIDEQALYHILIEEQLDDGLRLRAAQRLSDEKGMMWEESKTPVMLQLLVALDLQRLAAMFTQDPMLSLSHPYAALLIGHLVPANLDASLRSNLYACRTQALQAIHGADVPEVLSPMAEHLLLLMEGIYKETPEVAEVLNTAALRAFSPISRALEGDGVVSATKIQNLRKSLADLNLSAIERRLFEVMLHTLSVNRHMQAYNIGMAKKADAEQLDALLSKEDLPLRLIPTFSSLVVEHDLGLPNLVYWYQQHDPLSPWAPLARAALFASTGDELNSAREYTRAAELFSKVRKEQTANREGSQSEDNDSVLALPLALYRKSLIHYAHAKSWSEAVDLLEKVPSLKTAITERFKLYLRTCHDATTDTKGAARRIRLHVQRRIKVVDEDAEGNITERTKTVYDEEELDLLRNYPFQQAHLLPSEPFLGRVTAASTHISRDLRRSRTQYEHQFRQAMQTPSPSMEEVYEIAKNAAEEGAFEGLMYLERAQNSTKFSVSARQRLAGVEQSLFSQYKENVPTSKRRFLHNLSLMPLVLVDTNVLVDALVEKAYQRMNLVFETNIDIMVSNRFHHILLHHAKAKRLHMMIPDDVRGELKQFAKDHRLMPRFRGAMVDNETLEATLSEDVMLELVDDVLSDYSTWTPTSDMLSDLPTTSETLDAFLIRHTDVFTELTELKEMRGITHRTELEGRAVYPEATDLDIYRLAMHLASQALPNIGSLLVATMDGDFTLLDRAIEEKFGFSVAKNNRTLKPWLKRQTT